MELLNHVNTEIPINHEISEIYGNTKKLYGYELKNRKNREIYGSREKRNV